MALPRFSRYLISVVHLCILLIYGVEIRKAAYRSEIVKPVLHTPLNDSWTLTNQVVVHAKRKC